MKVGDLVKLHKSERKNGKYAGMLGIVVDLDPYDIPVVNVEGEIKDFHYTQIEEIIYGN